MKTVEHSEKARKLLTQLVEDNPTKPQAIRALGVLLRDIEHMNDEADLLFTQANTIEDEAMKVLIDKRQ
ncbi:MAG: hypothetical protein EZS28_021335 [Streblomastix strix]|uniref:Uncharacterized protein n=1 Tax=Streblomastix strix TaxID=222440 RepID=A0A5J4VKK9_9EUKA|nr:MAG: hypothetical protein EZS28_021335 [Streblomastix strix]